VRDLGAVRVLVSGVARAAGLDADRIDDLVIAVNEVATNAIKYGDLGGRVVAWATPCEVICQLEDPGHITDRLAGRHAPVAGTNGGIGLWMVNQLCDLVQVRTARGGTTIRLHAAL
jgi:anti-sigma regulatory factor (Ser/Thr protein kinase)